MQCQPFRSGARADASLVSRRAAPKASHCQLLDSPSSWRQDSLPDEGNAPRDRHQLHELYRSIEITGTWSPLAGRVQRRHNRRCIRSLPFCCIACLTSRQIALISRLRDLGYSSSPTADVRQRSTEGHPFRAVYRECNEYHPIWLERRETASIWRHGLPYLGLGSCGPSAAAVSLSASAPQ